MNKALVIAVGPEEGEPSDWGHEGRCVGCGRPALLSEDGWCQTCWDRWLSPKERAQRDRKRDRERERQKASQTARGG